jgi:hypothetical protein
MVSSWSDLTPFGKYASQANQYYWFAWLFLTFFEKIHLKIV